MHPIERLRYVARAGVVPVVPLVRESAAALSSFADDPKGLLTSCRRLLDRRRDCGPLVWLAARMLAAMDPRSEAIRVIEALDADTTGRALEDGLHTLRAGSSVLAVGSWGSSPPHCTIDRTCDPSIRTTPRPRVQPTWC